MFSKLVYQGDGVTTEFAINFTLGILERADVRCRVNDEVDGAELPVYREITWIHDGLVSISGAVPLLDEDVVFTRTVSKTIMEHDYQDGAALIEKNLDESGLQLMHAIHELLDGRFEASPGIGDGDYATMEQLGLAVTDLQAQIDALSLRIDDILAELEEGLIEMVEGIVDAALDEAGLASGDRLIQHQYDEYTDTTLTTTMLPFTSTPSIIDGDEILSCTITNPTEGNSILCTAMALGHPNSACNAMAMFINGVHVRSAYTRSANNTTTFPLTMNIQHQFLATSTDDIVITVRAGSTITARGIILNDGNLGGQSATLTAQEIGSGSGEGGGGITIPEPGDPFSQEIYLPGLLCPARRDNTGIIYTFTENVKIAITGNVLNGVTCTLDAPETSSLAWFTLFNQVGALNDHLLIGTTLNETVIPDAQRIINTPSGTLMAARISGGYFNFLVGDQLSFNCQTGHGGASTDAAGARLLITGLYT